MKFFTEEAFGWDAPPGVSRAAREGYRTHLAQLWPALTPDLRSLAETDLQDGLIRQLVLDRRTDSLTLRLRCGCLQDPQGVPVGYFDLDLHYRQVALTPADVEALRDLAADRGAEVLYQELDREPDGRFVHRLRCTGGVEYDAHRLVYAGGREYEVAIQFRELELARQPVEQRHGRGWPRRRYLEC